MKHIYLNLKRFDVPMGLGGVNALAPVSQWGGKIVRDTQEALKKYSASAVEFPMFFPEGHILPAVEAIGENSPILIGCQSVYRENVAAGANFGAFTSNRPAAAARSLGCTHTIIGHCEERRDKAGILSEAGVTDSEAINRLLGREIQMALDSGLSVLYCVGETADERPDWENVIGRQISTAFGCVNDTSEIVFAYEPVWAIGPGKTPPGREDIQKAARYIKKVSNGLDVVYGGGLKADNAAMLASIPEIDGGLIALTRFSDDIGFYPAEYLEIIRRYLGK